MRKGRRLRRRPFLYLAVFQSHNRKTSGADRIRTCDLEVMSLASYRAAPPRVIGVADVIGRSSRVHSLKAAFRQISRTGSASMADGSA